MRMSKKKKAPSLDCKDCGWSPAYCSCPVGEGEEKNKTIAIGDKIQLTGEVIRIYYEDKGEGPVRGRVEVKLDITPFETYSDFYTLSLNTHIVEKSRVP